ncbi:MAG: hypothetical protein Q7S55_04585 [Nanoarchaeota archaeon]|nr:hypothetical protein [Nanoarchaeota archaeon]
MTYSRLGTPEERAEFEMLWKDNISTELNGIRVALERIADILEDKE